MESILIAVGSSVGTVLVLSVSALLIRVWRTPKRLNRLEKLLPPMARAMLVILRVHTNQEVNGEVREALTGLEEVLTESAVSQKGST